MSSQHAPCVAILVYCSVRNWTWFCYVIGFENIRIHPSTRYQIRYGFIFFSLWRADLKISKFAVEFTGWVWIEAGSGKKKLRIQKYPDTCGRGVKIVTKYCCVTWKIRKYANLVLNLLAY